MSARDERHAGLAPALHDREHPVRQPGAVHSSAIAAPTAGVISDGLNTTTFPASSAGTMWPLAGGREV
jgi:hypothetical protein